MAGNKVHDGTAPAPARKLCGAVKRQGGGTCTQAAGWGTKHPGEGRCKLHGGSSTGPGSEEGKRKVAANAVKHGGYMDKILSETERDIYDALFDQTIASYKLSESNAMHMATLHRACMSYIKTLRLDEWEMVEEWIPNKLELGKKGRVLYKNGKPVLISRPVFDKAGQYVGEESGSLRRIRWASNAPNWEAHFQKYMVMLGTDRSSELKAKQESKTASKVVATLNWLWGAKTEGEEHP